jgi:hypothetical protein
MPEPAKRPVADGPARARLRSVEGRFAGGEAETLVQS